MAPPSSSALVKKCGILYLPGLPRHLMLQQAMAKGMSSSHGKAHDCWKHWWRVVPLQQVYGETHLTWPIWLISSL